MYIPWLNIDLIDNEMKNGGEVRAAKRSDAGDCGCIVYTVMREGRRGASSQFAAHERDLHSLDIVVIQPSLAQTKENEKMYRVVVM